MHRQVSNTTSIQHDLTSRVQSNQQPDTSSDSQPQHTVSDIQTEPNLSTDDNDITNNDTDNIQTTELARNNDINNHDVINTVNNIVSIVVDHAKVIVSIKADNQNNI